MIPANIFPGELTVVGGFLDRKDECPSASPTNHAGRPLRPAAARYSHFLEATLTSAGAPAMAAGLLL